MQNLVFKQIEQPLRHLIEEEQQLIKTPILVDEVVKTAMFVVRSDEDVRSNISIIETVDQVDYVFRLGLDHITGLLLNGIEVEF